MPANEWLGKIAEAVGSRSLEETREHIQEYFQATNHEGVMPASLMSMHEQQYNNQPVQIIHPNAIIECAMPLPIQQPPRLSPRCFARIKQQQQTLLGAYCAAAEWTREEQIVLEEGLKRFPASQYNNLTRYVKIAAFLPDKTITDVAKRYKWMVELQRLNSINFSDDTEGGQPASGQPASPSESSTLHQSTGGSFAPNGDQIEPIISPAQRPAAAAAASNEAKDGGSAAGRDSQDTVTSEGGVLRLLDENETFIANVKESLAAQPPGAATVDADIMENMIRFRSNLSNVLNCLAMVSGCMSKMPPLLVKLHPLPIIESADDGTEEPVSFAAAAVPPAGEAAAAAAADTPEEARDVASTGASAGAAAGGSVREVKTEVAGAADDGAAEAQAAAAAVAAEEAFQRRKASAAAAAANATAASAAAAVAAAGGAGVGEETPAESAEETAAAEDAAEGGGGEEDADDSASPGRSRRKRKRR